MPQPATLNQVCRGNSSGENAFAGIFVENGRTEDLQCGSTLVNCPIMSHRRKIAPETLMRRFKVGLDQAAFEQLVWEYAPPAKAVAYQILGDRPLAEDAVQETFVRLIKKRDRYSSSEGFSSWFYVILRNVCIDMLRRRRRESDLARQVGNEIADSAPAESESDHVSLLGMLPFRERSVLELRVVHSMSFKEIAAALDISKEAAKKRAQRGLCRLREALSRSAWIERRAM